MFYPVDSLRKGGRFYLLWLADSWPHRFASIPNRQLWSYDIIKLCDELKQVMVSESGRSINRYSLRLSSQLMRGLVRLYQRKASAILSNVCMINANVTKHCNKKFHLEEVVEQTGPSHRRQTHRNRVEAPTEELQIDALVQELQNSGNCVANIQDITLKEALVNDPVLPVNEGFGEENEEQVLQFLAGRGSVEQMMAGEPGAQLSALGLPGADTTAPHDTSRPAPHTLAMERISAHDLTLLRPSDGGLLSVTDLGKEIPDTPEFPILPIPTLPDPQNMQPEESGVAIPVDLVDQPRGSPPRDGGRDAAHENTQIELEELEEVEPRVKRRRKWIIDKKIKIATDVFQARIQNHRVELRCEEFPHGRIDLQVPYQMYMHRPAHAGYKKRCNIAHALTNLFMRKLCVINNIHQEFEDAEMEYPRRHRTRSRLEQIPEVAEPAEAPQPQLEEAQQINATVEENLPLLEVDKTKGADVPEQDISDMLTQKLQTLSPEEAEKRGADGGTPPLKRLRSVGYVSFRENQMRLRESQASIEFMEVSKENIPENQQTPGRVSKRADMSVTAMLHEAGLVDTLPQPPQVIEPLTPQKRRRESETSESLLGSVDRTKVSLGDTDSLSESIKFIRDQWGVEGTMTKFIECIKSRRRGDTITMSTLVARRPILAEYKNIITAKCFTSVLKLKQHGFIAIKKCPMTLEILDMMLGPKLQRTS